MLSVSSRQSLFFVPRALGGQATRITDPLVDADRLIDQVAEDSVVGDLALHLLQLRRRFEVAGDGLAALPAAEVVLRSVAGVVGIRGAGTGGLPAGTAHGLQRARAE